MGLILLGQVMDSNTLELLITVMCPYLTVGNALEMFHASAAYEASETLSSKVVHVRLSVSLSLSISVSMSPCFNFISPE